MEKKINMLLLKSLKELLINHSKMHNTYWKNKDGILTQISIIAQKISRARKNTVHRDYISNIKINERDELKLDYGRP